MQLTFCVGQFSFPTGMHVSSSISVFTALITHVWSCVHLLQQINEWIFIYSNVGSGEVTLLRCQITVFHHTIVSSKDILNISSQ